MKQTLGDAMKKTLALIEELNPDSQYLTDDPDIRAKIRYVVNQVQFELARMKKIPAYVEMAVRAGDVLRLADIAEQCGREVYQLGTVCGVRFSPKAGGTVLKIGETGTAQIDCFVYPAPITAGSPDSQELDLSADALEILPYGVAADLLKSDVSAEYGSIYAKRYETMLQRLDPRYAMASIFIEGGVEI